MDDGTLVVGSRDKSLSLWRCGRLVRVLKGHQHCVTALASLPNGTLASGDFKGTIKFWRQGFWICNMDFFLLKFLGIVHAVVLYHIICDAWL